MKIKICGITSIEDAKCAADAGADFIGFIFYAKSERYVSPVKAAMITATMPATIRTVGVFVNESVEHITDVAETAGLDRIQLHGDESIKMLHQLQGYDPIKAIALKEEKDLEVAAAFEGFTLLVDTPCPEYGGSGKTGDWILAAACASKYPTIVAGGLTVENVGQAIRQIRPIGVDVSSGVEISQGKKDHDRIRQFIANARMATR
jgi:phosphoribosylanthranilate isomerase